jgi:hypothetical protein
MKKKLVAVALVFGYALQVIPAQAATLTATMKTQLTYLVEEEKLARDVYVTLYSKTGVRQFNNINRAEQTHMGLVQGLLKTYSIKDPTVGKALGVFSNKSLAALYKKLISDGSVSTSAALAAGVLVEKTDIKDVTSLIKTKPPTDVQLVLDRLLSGSQRHLVAFNR